jgi:hypothetical protein
VQLLCVEVVGGKREWGNKESLKKIDLTITKKLFDKQQEVGD